MNIIIAGSRSLIDYNKLKIHCLASITELNKIFTFNMDEITIISGNCRKGADKLGEIFAKEMGFPIRSFPADWTELHPVNDKDGSPELCIRGYTKNGIPYNKLAGRQRNNKMARYCFATNSALFAFWDYKSPGTKHMIEQARLYNIHTIIIDIR